MDSLPAAQVAIDRYGSPAGIQAAQVWTTQPCVVDRSASSEPLVRALVSLCPSMLVTPVFASRFVGRMGWDSQPVLASKLMRHVIVRRSLSQQGVGVNNVKKCVFYLFFSTVTGIFSTLAHAASLTIHLQDYRHPGATAYIAVYAVKDGASWGDEPAKLIMSPPLAGDEMKLEAELPAGRYALRAFVDINSNGELDTGAFGKPKEPFAFSRKTGAADSLRFKAAAVDVGESGELVLRFLHPEAKASKANSATAGTKPTAPWPPG